MECIQNGFDEMISRKLHITLIVQKYIDPCVRIRNLILREGISGMCACTACGRV